LFGYSGVAGLLLRFRRLLDRWSRQQETALSQMTERKAAGLRTAGFSKSERVDGKFFLLAFAPFVPLMASDYLGVARGILWEGWFWLSSAWAVTLLGILLAAYWRAFRRSLGRKP
jgi:hypothetical protein